MADKAKDVVTVRMQLFGRWEFYGEVQMSRADFDKYEKALDAGGREHSRAIKDISANFVDFSLIDVQDAEELDDFWVISEAASHA